MNRESIELRIDELEIRKQQLLEKKEELSEKILKVEARIEEMWEWLDAEQSKGEYGYRKLEGGVEVMKVPTFKTQDEMAKALKGEPSAIGGIEAEETHEMRDVRRRKDAQIAIDALDGQSPLDKDDADRETDV